MVIRTLLLSWTCACAYISPEDAAARRDVDGDGSPGNEDCDDNNPDVFPAAVEADCATVDINCDGELAGALDADGDGLTPCDGDCNDADSAIPGVETCNGVDDDCDGTLDNDPVDPLTFFADSDLDGFGDGENPVLACSLPSDAVENDSDCDDQNPDAFPGAAEDCGANDLNCDGDAMLGATVGATEYYPDLDNDGYGRDGNIELLCEQLDGYAVASGDCDDQNNGVSPAESEVCDDGLDNDCDGGVNECGLSGSTALGLVSTEYFGEEGDQLGVSVVGGNDLDGDGIVDAVVGAPDRDGMGAVLAIRSDDGVYGQQIDYAAPTSLIAGADFGAAVAMGQVGTVGENGVLVGMPGGNGGVALCFATGNAGLDCAATFEDDTADSAGTRVAILGDAWDLGEGVWLVGAPGADGAGSNAGVLYLLEGRLGGGDLRSTASRAVDGAAPGDAAGTGLGTAAGDSDGDGISEWISGSPGDGTGPGAAYVLAGDSSATTLLDADFTLAGEVAGDQAGRAVDFAGDINADGYSDILVGATSHDAGGTSAGAVYLLCGPVSTGSLSAATAKLVGAASDFAGWSVTGVGDVDGDGRDDWAAGSIAGTGVVYLYREPVSGTQSLTSANAVLSGDNTGDKAGWSVSRGGDADGDGADEFLAGAYGFGSPDAGAGYLVWGTGL